MKSNIDWEWCKGQGLAKPVSKDIYKIRSIIDSATDREKTAKLLPLNNTTKETVISLLYDVLRELLESLALQRGFKIYNHECFRPFLRNVIGDDKFAGEFDSLRLLRNSINYYGKKIELSEARIIVSKLERLIKAVRGLLE